MSTVPSKVLNDLFFEKLSTGEGKEKINQYGGNYVRDRLREVSFARKVVPPEPVQRTDCQRSVNHDTLVRIVDIEPNSRAMSLTFRGQPTSRLIRAPRFEIPFHTIASEKFEKPEQELLVYEMPITKIIEDNSVKDMQSIEDRVFLVHVESCVQAMQYEGNGNAYVAFKTSKLVSTPPTVVSVSVIKGETALSSATDDFVAYPVMKTDFLRLKSVLHGRHLRAEQVLMTEQDFDNLSAWTIQDVWSEAENTAKKGWTSDTVTGLKIIRTIKVEILRTGNIYCFTAPEFFGRFYILNNTKFYIDKIANVITWQSWEDIGMGFGNIASVVKLELYSGSVTPTQETSGYAAMVPMDESDMFPVNNRADAGMTYPQVETY